MARPAKHSTSNDENLFSVTHLRTGFKERAVKSTGITIFAQGLKLILQLISITVLARLLEPSDFGLVTMVTVFTGLATTFMDGGLSMATIQREHVTRAQVSNLSWLNAGLGLVIFVLAIALAPVVAWIYDEPRLTYIMYALSLSFLIGGLSIQHDALLKRQMRFKAIAGIDVLSMTIGIASAIWMASMDYGYWALVAMPVVTISCQTLLRWAVTGWVPSMVKRGADTLPLVNFGLNLTGANFVGYFATNITPFMVGLIGGATSLGLYNRAFTIASLPTRQVLPPIMSVMQSALSRLAGEPDRLRHVTLSLMKKIAIATMFITTCMVVMADWLIEIFLGASWNEAVPIFRILALLSIVTPITTFTAITLIALGEARALMRWKMITLCILAASLFAGSFWGFMGVIWAHGISGFFIRMPLFLFYASKFQPISFKDFLSALIPSLFSSFATALTLLAFRQVYEPATALSALLIYSLAATVIYLLFCLAIRSMRHQVIDALQLVRTLLATGDR